MRDTQNRRALLASFTKRMLRIFGRRCPSRDGRNCARRQAKHSGMPSQRSLFVRLRLHAKHRASAPRGKFPGEGGVLRSVIQRDSPRGFIVAMREFFQWPLPLHSHHRAAALFQFHFALGQRFQPMPTRIESRSIPNLEFKTGTFIAIINNHFHAFRRTALRKFFRPICTTGLSGVKLSGVMQT